MPRNKLGLISIQIFTTFQNVTELILFIIAKPLTVVCELAILIVVQGIGLHHPRSRYNGLAKVSITNLRYITGINVSLGDTKKLKT